MPVLPLTDLSTKNDMKDNILMNHYGEPLITDFGLSRMITYSQTFMASAMNGSIKRSLRWMAYELLSREDEAKHTKESDMWAYGMTIYVCMSPEILAHVLTRTRN